MYAYLSRSTIRPPEVRMDTRVIIEAQGLNILIKRLNPRSRPKISLFHDDAATVRTCNKYGSVDTYP